MSDTVSASRLVSTKTDQAQRLFRAGELTTITVPTADQEAVRDLVRARDDVRKDLTAARHRLGKFLIRHGRVFHGGSNWTRRFWEWLGKQQFEREAERLTFQHYVHEVEHHTERRAELNRQIEAVARSEPYAKPVAKLSCLRGTLCRASQTERMTSRQSPSTDLPARDAAGRAA